MKALHQIRVVYAKELIDVLRDRRTLIAMILIPVVLYPTIVLGFLWLAQSEQQRMRGERFVVEVDNPQMRDDLESMIAHVQAKEKAAPGEQNVFEVRVAPDGRKTVSDQVQLHISISIENATPPLPRGITAHITYNEVDYKSKLAVEQLTKLLDAFRDMVARESVVAILTHNFPGTPVQMDADRILNPLNVESTSVATQSQRGGWALGQILPIILVLMTITGAIYPAIDLTAGERERGTLETLMSTPIPILRLVAGKYLVVATIALLTALLNLASVGATMHFSGLTRVLTADHPVRIPLAVLPVALLCMVPLALLFSAVLLAVCSFARTFKEAQNYVTPVMILALIPSCLVSMPSARLEGVMTVVPVANMVLLCRELFQQTVRWDALVVVVLSTSLYAVAAIAVAARLFGKEAVLFADAGSYRTLLSRRFLHPVPLPSASQALLLAAFLFPVSFHVQGALFGEDLEQFQAKMKWIAVVQFGLLFVVIPIALCGHFKINLGRTFQLALPPAWAWPTALLLGVSSWALAHEMLLLQPRSEALIEMSRQLEAHFNTTPLGWLILLIAIVPAVCEELFFRGFLLSGLSTALSRGPAIITCGLIFGVFHFMVDRMPLTAIFGMVLALLCWQSRSIWPGMIFHAMHNASSLLLSRFPQAAIWLGMSTAEGEPSHIRPAILISASCLFLLALLLTFACSRRWTGVHIPNHEMEPRINADKN